MSVAIGIAPAPGAGPPAFTAEVDAGRGRPSRRRRRWRAAPPSARTRSSPVTSSRLISRPTTKKKRAMRPSFDQVAEVTVEADRSRPGGGLGVPQGDVAAAPRGVGPHQGDCGGQQQGQPAGGLGAEELLEAAGQPGTGLHGGRARGRLGNGRSGVAADDDADQASRHSRSPTLGHLGLEAAKIALGQGVEGVAAVTVERRPVHHRQRVRPHLGQLQEGGDQVGGDGGGT